MSDFLRGWPDEPTIFDLPEFRQYAKEVEKVVLKYNERGASIADIHRELGRDRIRWTCSALEWIGCEERGALPTRYVKSKTKFLAPIDWRESMVRKKPPR